MTNHPRRKCGPLAGLVAIATALMLAFGTLAPAQANPLGNIDPDLTATLSIHKSVQPAPAATTSSGGLEIVGDELAALELVPMDEITFTVQVVGGINLMENDGWVAAGEMTVDEAMAAVTGKVYTNRTGNGPPSIGSGTAEFRGLPLGLYVVTEQPAYGYSTGPEWFPAAITPSAPFLVALPMAHPTISNGWLYDVHVYPKNAITSASKTVQDGDAVQLGEDVEWTIKGDIPKVTGLDGYKIVDLLDPKLTLGPDDPSVSIVENELQAPEAQLVKDVDYELFIALPAAVGDPSTVSVVFTKDGRDKLAGRWTAHPTAQVQVSITTVVNQVGVVANTATVYPNLASFDVQPGQPGGPIETPEVITKYGNILLKKIDSKSGAALEGAEFRVFLTEATAKAGVPAVRDASDESTFTSRADGKVMIEGLRYSDWANGVEQYPGPTPPRSELYQSYWIVETKAPSGFVLLSEPIEVRVLSDSFEIVEGAQVIENVPKNAGFELPLTGASGARTIVMVAGLVLLMVGTTAVVVSRRKRHQVEG